MMEKQTNNMEENAHNLGYQVEQCFNRIITIYEGFPQDTK